MKTKLLAVVLFLLALSLWLLLGLDSGNPDSEADFAPASPSSLLLSQVTESERTEAPDSTESRRRPTSAQSKPEVDTDIEGMESGWGRIEITVLEEGSGRPVPGVFVNVEALPLNATPLPDGAIGGEATETNTAGWTWLKLRSGFPFAIQVQSIGAVEPLALLEIEALSNDEKREIVVHVDKGRVQMFWVQIVAAEDGRPLIGARVQGVDTYGQNLNTDVAVPSSSWLHSTPLATTDEHGYVGLHASRMVQKRFAAIADGCGPAFFLQERAATSPKLALKVRLAEGATIRAQVVDQAGRPIPGASVRMGAEFADLSINQPGMAFGSHTVTQVTDRTGLAVFEGLSSGVPFQAALLVPGFGPEWQTPEAQSSVLDSGEQPVLDPGEQLDMTLVAGLPADLIGLALDQNDEPAAGVELLLLRDKGEQVGYLQWPGAVVRTAIVGDDGRFSFQGVPPGRWLLAPRPLRTFLTKGPYGGLTELERQIAPVPTALTINGQEPISELTLRLWRGLYVRGILLGPDDQPVTHSETQLLARFRDGPGFVVQRVETDGTFAIGPLPDLALQLEAWGAPDGLTAAKIESHAGEDNVVLRLIPSGTLLLRTINRASGEGLASTYTALRTDSQGVVTERQAYQASGTELEWNGLTPGTWHVLARGPSELVGLRMGIEVHAGYANERLPLELEPGGILELVVPETATQNAVHIGVYVHGVRFEQFTLAPGAREEITLPAGEVEVIEEDTEGEAGTSQTLSLSGSMRTTWTSANR